MPATRYVHHVLATLARALAARRGRRLIVAGWVALVVAAFPFAQHLTGAETNQLIDLLPGHAASTQALRIDPHFPGGSAAVAVAVFYRAGGLSSTDTATVDKDRQLLASVMGGVSQVSAPSRAPNGKAELLTVGLTGDEHAVSDKITQIRHLLRDRSGAMTIRVTGPAAIQADLLGAFSHVDLQLLVAVAALVAVLLILTYRSPFLWAIPIVATGAAEALTQAVLYVLSRAGVVVTGQSVGLATVIVFGAGTDYALLITSRYRTNLTHAATPGAAMNEVLPAVATTITASALTVVAALACLLAADYNLTRAFGIAGMVGVMSAALAALSLYPALLVASGRGIFWPKVPRPVSPSAATVDVGGWQRVADTVARRRKLVWPAATAGLLILAAGLGLLNTDVTTLNDLPANSGAIQGQKLLVSSFPAGETAPIEVVVSPPSQVSQVRNRLSQVPGVTRVDQPETSGRYARFNLITNGPPSGHAAFHQIRELRAAVATVPSTKVLVGGQAAEDVDTAAVAQRDQLVVVPIVLAVVLVLLFAYLGAALASAVLVATVVLSFAAGLGAAIIVFRSLGWTGVDPTVPLLVFVFLVVLGVDYNIFLVGRIREERNHSTTENAVTTSLASTGGVLTSAGVILAGTFAVLSVIPILASRELGIAVAVGVLLDTVVVRTLLVPSVALHIGEPFWWPSTSNHSLPTLAERPA